MGTGTEISISELAQLVANVTGFTGQIRTDPSKPDGTMRKLMDVGRLAKWGGVHALISSKAWRTLTNGI